MFSPNKILPVLLLSITAFITTVVHAETIPMRGPIPFAVFDKDSNKMISPQEFVETHNLRIKMRNDANMPSGRNMRSFTHFDINGDNQISEDELNKNRGFMRNQRMMQSGDQGRGMNPGRQIPKFTDFDLDGNGALLKDEFYKAREQRMRQRAEQGYRMRNAASAPPFGILDGNSDGKVTEEEFLAFQKMHRQMRARPQP